ncbi:hypothetical protein [Methylovulum psychrotolerans]|jgi:hypothetical protein|uniref:hypothetical protein n=1 Tax=Methylovulum psychrotolerans TaxID=1704499 RepID=UPI0012FA1185|nr:hypothetical protein [Methylovulum psychrotolerans]MBT9097487.1 hypothetical protein [Methylovulum psychrotolerans]
MKKNVLNICYASFLSLLFTSAPASADLLLSAVGFGGNSQASVVCYLFNAGTSFVQITSKRIYSVASTGSASSALSLTLNGTCGTFLSPNQICSFSANVTSADVNACKAVFWSSIPSRYESIRGEMEIRDINGNILRAQPLK